jgi:uncharacterized protein (TIGR03435 family)
MFSVQPKPHSPRLAEKHTAEATRNTEPNAVRTQSLEPAPGFFEAIQQQLGLKLTAVKTQVDVLTIDHIEKPSSN